MHISTCTCSVCWARNYCDAIAMFPSSALDLPLLAPPPNYYKFYDCTKDFLAVRKRSKEFNSARFPNQTPA